MCVSVCVYFYLNIIEYPYRNQVDDEEATWLDRVEKCQKNQCPKPAMQISSVSCNLWLHTGHCQAGSSARMSSMHLRQEVCPTQFRQQKAKQLIRYPVGWSSVHTVQDIP